MKPAIVVVSWILMADQARSQGLNELTALYDYDRKAPLNVQQNEIPTRGGYKLYSIRYDLPKGGHMSGFLVLPDRLGRKPAIVWIHSGGAIQFLGNAVLMARGGAISLLVGQAEGLPEHSSEQVRDSYIAAVVGLRRGIDLLESRSDVDGKRLALVGHSFGAMMSAVAASIDTRLRTAVFEAGLLGMSIHIGTSPHPWAEGIRKQLGSELPQFLRIISVVDAKNYVGHAPAIPKLFQSAWYDPGVPRQDADDFFQATSGPKEMKWYDTGHDIDDIAGLADRARFLAQHLGLRNVDRLLQEKIGRR